MAETRPYRVVKGKHGRWVDGEPVTYRPGDTIYLTEAQARRMTSATGSMVEPLWAADEPATEPASESTENEFAAILEGPIPKVREHIATVEDPAALEEMRDAEAAGKSRKGVFGAVEERLEVLDNE